MMNSNLKQIALNLAPAFAGVFSPDLRVPAAAFLSAYPNLMLILIFSFGFVRGSASGMCYLDWWPDC